MSQTRKKPFKKWDKIGIDKWEWGGINKASWWGRLDAKKDLRALRETGYTKKYKGSYLGGHVFITIYLYS